MPSLGVVPERIDWLRGATGPRLAAAMKSPKVGAIPTRSSPL
jgi:hypothetical protein